MEVKMLQNIAKKIFGSNVLLHVFFILFVFLLLCLISIIGELPSSRILRVIMIGIFLLMCIYAGRWNSRRWLLSNKLFMSAIYATVTIIVLSVIGIIGLRIIPNKLSPALVLTASGFVFIFFAFGMLLSIGRTTIMRQINEARISQEHRESELQLLRSQLSPHFLFNVLNSLYGLSLAEDKKVPVMLLKLSDLLRYSIYDTKPDFVPLINELEYIDNYVELEKIRIGDKLSLDFNIQKTNLENIKIAPMLLIIFIENAFKHSKNTLLPKIHINIDLRIIDDYLVFSVKNSYAGDHEERQSNVESGIGLAVTLRRLDLLYHGKYLLENSKQNNYYQIKLQLRI
jgi:sensor histidine kinase YesM